MQRNKQMAMGRKKFNMDPKKVSDNGKPIWTMKASPSIDFSWIAAVFSSFLFSFA